MTATPVATLDLVPLLLRSVSNQKICAVVTLNEHVELATLARSMRHLLQHIPVLASELVIHRGTPRWRYRADRARCAAPQLVNVAAESDDSDSALEKYLATLAAAKGDTFEIRVLRHSLRDTLCIALDHTAADGAGCREIVRQLALIYTQMQRGEQIIFSSVAGRSRDLDCVSRELGAMRSLRCMLRAGIAPPKWHFDAAKTGQTSRPHYVLRHFSAGQSGGLTAMSQRYRATINDLLLAALFRALLDTHGGDDKRRLPLQITADLRRYLPNGQRARIANLSGTDCVWLDASLATRFSILVTHTHSRMRRIKMCTPGAGSSLWLKFLFALGFERARLLLHRAFNSSRRNGLANPLLTNFGTLDGHIPRFGTAAVRHAGIIAPSLLAPGLVIGASAFQNTLTLSTGFDANITDPLLIGNVLDRMINDLESA